MTVSMVPLVEANMLAARDLLMQAWAPYWSDAFSREYFDWRYRARPAGETRLAFDGPRCIAILDSFLRRYVVSGRMIMVRETCDWFCLPRYRPLGIGIKLMRHFMAAKEPILTVGGGAATLALLPNLGWHRLQDAREHVLPVSARAMAAGFLRRLQLGQGAMARYLPSIPVLRPARRARRIAAERRVRMVDLGGRLELPLPEGYSLAMIGGEENWRWLTIAPEALGHVVGLLFAIDGVFAGFTVSRLEPWLFGRRGKILHLQVVGSPKIIGWVLAETASRLIAEGAESVVCRSSCPWISTALSEIGFFQSEPKPVYWWAGNAKPPTDPIHLTFYRADDAVPFSHLDDRSHARPTLAEQAQERGSHA